jgi:hypothetical protein
VFHIRVQFAIELFLGYFWFLVPASVSVSAASLTTPTSASPVSAAAPTTSATSARAVAGQRVRRGPTVHALVALVASVTSVASTPTLETVVKPSLLVRRTLMIIEIVLPCLTEILLSLTKALLYRPLFELHGRLKG